MRKPSLLVLGSSRAHRPFSKRHDGIHLTPFDQSLDVSFSNAGYFHSVLEMAQLLQWMSRSTLPTSPSLQYAFREEPHVTTPGYVFDSSLKAAILAGGGSWDPGFDPSKIDFVLVENSSLTVHQARSDGMFLHTNPNFSARLDYRDIYPDGYYSKVGLADAVTRRGVQPDELASALEAIRLITKCRRVVVVGHIVCTGRSDGIRGTNNALLRRTCEALGETYIDTAPICDAHGFAIVDGRTDIHHLSHQGELALGQAVVDVCRLS